MCCSCRNKQIILLQIKFVLYPKLALAQAFFGKMAVKGLIIASLQDSARTAPSPALQSAAFELQRNVVTLSLCLSAHATQHAIR